MLLLSEFVVSLEDVGGHYWDVVACMGLAGEVEGSRGRAVFANIATMQMEKVLQKAIKMSGDDVIILSVAVLNIGIRQSGSNRLINEKEIRLSVP